MNRALGRRIVEQRGASLEPGDRSGVDDDAAFRQVRQCGARRAVHRQDVDGERVRHLLVREFLECVAMLLIRRVVDEDVEASEVTDRVVHDARAHAGIGETARQKQGRLARTFYVVTCDFGVTDFFGQMADGDIRALAREHDGYRAPDAGVAAGDERHLAAEFCGWTIVGRFVPRQRRQFGFDPRLGMMLRRERRFRLVSRHDVLLVFICAATCAAPRRRSAPAPRSHAVRPRRRRGR